MNVDLLPSKEFEGGSRKGCVRLGVFVRLERKPTERGGLERRRRKTVITLLKRDHPFGANGEGVSTLGPER